MSGGPRPPRHPLRWRQRLPPALPSSQRRVSCDQLKVEKVQAGFMMDRLARDCVCVCSGEGGASEILTRKLEVTLPHWRGGRQET